MPDDFNKQRNNERLENGDPNLDFYTVEAYASTLPELRKKFLEDGETLRWTVSFAHHKIYICDSTQTHEKLLSNLGIEIGASSVGTISFYNKRVSFEVRYYDFSLPVKAKLESKIIDFLN